MKELKEKIKAREQWLLNVINLKQDALKRAPVGSVFSNVHGKTRQFYRRMPNGDRIYLKKDDELIKALAQKEYDQNVLSAAEKEIKQIRKLRLMYDDVDQAEDQIGKLHPAKRSFVKPIVLTDAEYVQIWLSKPYPKSDFKEEH